MLRAYHVTHPLRASMPEEELRSRLGPNRELAAELLNRMFTDGTVVRRQGGVALAAHRIRLSAEQQLAVDAALQELRAQPFAPPAWDEIVARHRLDASLTQYLFDQGLIVRIGTDTVYSRDAYERAVERLKQHLRASGRLTVSEARDLLGSSRKYVLPLLEWLDAQKVTRRVGDDRILRP
jgi:selenocysteine-specific elongation factor